MLILISKSTQKTKYRDKTPSRNLQTIIHHPLIHRDYITILSSTFFKHIACKVLFRWIETQQSSPLVILYNKNSTTWTFTVRITGTAVKGSHHLSGPSCHPSSTYHHATTQGAIWNDTKKRRRCTRGLGEGPLTCDLTWYTTKAREYCQKSHAYSMSMRVQGNRDGG